MFVAHVFASGFLEGDPYIEKQAPREEGEEEADYGSDNEYGEDGDDVWLPVQDYGIVETNESGNAYDYGYGGNGNDIVRGTHLAGYQYLHGGADHDKVYGGDGITDYNYLMGNDGDDWVEGGDNFEL